ncbi:uncharacterized protein LOC117344066 [Pecten maximus]|uniref:uncharacterized protein LOC117344066 n=1 Tax=Pecten maximus TaxID=6579 RepID=UPI00145825F6|nr:uncharacterized protein LOC117344066 [Pecten maximus]
MDNYIYKQPSVDNKDSPKKGTKNSANKESKKDGGVLSLLGKKKKPARQKKAQELKRQSRVLTTDSSSAIGKRYGSVDCSPTSPPWRGAGRGSGRTSIGSCPNSPMMTGYQGPKANIMTKSAFEAFWNGPEPLFDPTQGPKEYKKELSPESETGNKDIHLKPGGSPEVHRIQLRVSTAAPPTRPPPVYQNAAQLRSPPPKPKHTVDHNCAAGHYTRYRFPSPGVSPEIQRSNTPNSSRQNSQDNDIPADAPKSTATSVLPDHYKYLSDYTYSEPPPKPKHSMPQQFIVQEGIYNEMVTEQTPRNVVPQQYVTPDEIYSKAMPEKIQKNNNRKQCDKDEGIFLSASPDKGHRNPTQQIACSEGIYSQGSPERGRRSTMSSSSQSSPESPRAQIIRCSQHIHSGSGIIRRQQSLPTPGNSPEIQRILRSCPPPEDSPSPPLRARSAMEEGIYWTAAPVQVKLNHHGSLEDIKGGYSSEPDTIVWTSNHSNYSAIQSRSLPQKPPSSGRNQEQHRKNAPRKNPRRHTVGGPTLMQETPEDTAEEFYKKNKCCFGLIGISGADMYPTT